MAVLLLIRGVPGSITTDDEILEHDVPPR